METVKCPTCGAEETLTTMDESSMRVKCRNCGAVIEDTTDAAKMESAKPKLHFNGELMNCCMCGRKERHVVGSKSQWTLIGEEPFLCYVCPGCLQESEQAKRGHWSTLYQKIMRRYVRLRERHMRGLDN
jgi:hypothetical protein